MLIFAIPNSQSQLTHDATAGGGSGGGGDVAKIPGKWDVGSLALDVVSPPAVWLQTYLSLCVASLIHLPSVAHDAWIWKCILFNFLMMLNSVRNLDP